MLALAIEFSRCPRVRTLKAEQRVLAGRPVKDERRAPVSSTWSLPACHDDTCIERSPMRRSAKRLLRKEVIQPHLPVRLPCYDFTPNASPPLDGSPHKRLATGFGCCPLSWCDGRCVQAPGTYSPQQC